MGTNRPKERKKEITNNNSQIKEEKKNKERAFFALIINQSHLPVDFPSLSYKKKRKDNYKQHQNWSVTFEYMYLSWNNENCLEAQLVNKLVKPNGGEPGRIQMCMGTRLPRFHPLFVRSSSCLHACLFVHFVRLFGDFGYRIETVTWWRSVSCGVQFYCDISLWLRVRTFAKKKANCLESNHTGKKKEGLSTRDTKHW